VTSKYALDGSTEFLEIVVNCWNDDCDILGGKGGLAGYSNGLIEPMTDGVPDEAYISVN
jgi:hypothetical protein